MTLMSRSHGRLSQRRLIDFVSVLGVSQTILRLASVSCEWSSYKGRAGRCSCRGGIDSVKEAICAKPDRVSEWRRSELLNFYLPNSLLLWTMARRSVQKIKKGKRVTLFRLSPFVVHSLWGISGWTVVAAPATLLKVNLLWALLGYRWPARNIR